MSQNRSARQQSGTRARGDVEGELIRNALGLLPTLFTQEVEEALWADDLHPRELRQVARQDVRDARTQPVQAVGSRVVRKRKDGYRARAEVGRGHQGCPRPRFAGKGSRFLARADPVRPDAGQYEERGEDRQLAALDLLPAVLPVIPGDDQYRRQAEHQQEDHHAYQLLRQLVILDEEVGRLQKGPGTPQVENAHLEHLPAVEGSDEVEDRSCDHIYPFYPSCKPRSVRDASSTWFDAASPSLVASARRIRACLSRRKMPDLPGLRKAGVGSESRWSPALRNGMVPERRRTQTDLASVPTIRDPEIHGVAR